MSRHKEENQILIEAFMHRNETIIGSFYKRLWPKVLSLILNLGGNKEDAKDIMQNSFIVLYNKIRNGTYENREDALLSTYFLRICRYMMLNIKRSAHQTRNTSIELLEREVTGQQLEIDDNIFEEDALFDRYFIQLSERCKSILKDFYWQNHSLEELAETHGLTYESVKNAKYRCLKQLKKLMTKPSL